MFDEKIANGKINDYVANKLEDERVFEMLQSEKIESLKASIEDIQEAIKQRKQLSEEMITLMNKIIIDTDNFVIRLGSLSDNKDNELIRGEQMKLRQKQVEIEAMKVQEKLNCWRDIAQLKKELREHLREYRERESRSTMLDSLLAGED
ncbi:MAG: hypothetical protein N3D84_02295 [Candidatus Woesearchaeota archaeon]|nr:hypothetical protein [Candidatus Woesearchaeota archaeon]